MKILVIGGSRFLGRFISQQLLKKGHEVCLFNRGVSDPVQGATHIVGDIQHFVSYKAQLLAFEPDHVIHVIPYTEQHARDAVEVFAGTSCQIFVVSSVDCYETFQRFNRQQTCDEVVIDEASPTTSIRHYWRDLGVVHGGGELYDKNLMTDVFMAAYKAGDLATSIYRLPMIYGPLDRQFAHRHGYILRHIIDQEFSYVMGARRQGAVLPYMYVENAAAALVHAVEHAPSVQGQIFNLSSTKFRTYRAWAEHYAQVAQCQFAFEVIPDELLVSDLDRNSPANHMLVDGRCFRERTGFKDLVSHEEALCRTLQYAKDNPQVLPVIDYRAERQALERYKTFLQS